MFDFMQNVLLIFVEAMCCGSFFETFGEMRHKGWMNFIQVLLLWGSMCLYSYGLSGYFVPRQMAAIAVFSAFMLWHVRISPKKSFALAILFEALLLAMDYLAYLIIGRLFLGRALSERQYGNEAVLVYLLEKVTLFFLILIIRRQFGEKSRETMLDTEWLRLLFFPVFTIAAISAMLAVFRYIETEEQANLGVSI